MHEDDVLIAVHKVHDRFGGVAARLSMKMTKETGAIFSALRSYTPN